VTPRPRLSRAALQAAGIAADPAPVRILHLGLGAFFRAHQAWYTAHAGDATEWGIAAFTGRSPVAAAALAPQDGLYTLQVRGAETDRDEIVSSVVEAADGADIPRFLEVFRAPRLAVVTLTITEAGYRMRPDGSPDLDDPALAGDLDVLGAGVRESDPAVLQPTTALGRLLLGLEERRRTGGAGLALVPCDNLPDNGGRLARALTETASVVRPDLARWIEDRVSFVGTSVDRITPALPPDEVRAIGERGPWLDAAPVVTEPFSDWVLCGTFPAGRPAWEDAGARFVDDVGPWERRKLWLLNGAHTLLAVAGPLLGHETIASAIRDDRLRLEVERFWDEAARQLPASLGVPEYRAALLERFGNPRIEHRLAQIAKDGTTKLRVRIVPVAEAELRAGRLPRGCATAVAAWARSVPDPDGGGVRDRIAALSPTLADNGPFIAAVHSAMATHPDPEETR